MNNTVKKEIEVRYAETDYKKTTNIITILNYFNEVAQQAGEYYDEKKNILEEEKIAWIILNWDIEIFEYPKYLDKLTLKTIAHSIDRFIAFREFLIEDFSGRILSRGKSKWILLNVERRRPTAAREYMYNLYGVESSIPPFEIVSPPQISGYTSEIQFRVRKSDIDQYRHVNNVIYARWICESLPEEVTEKMALREFKIHFRKETTYGNMINVLTSREGNSHEYSHKITDKDGNALVFASTKWE